MPEAGSFISINAIRSEVGLTADYQSDRWFTWKVGWSVVAVVCWQSTSKASRRHFETSSSSLSRNRLKKLWMYIWNKSFNTNVKTWKITQPFMATTTQWYNCFVWDKHHRSKTSYTWDNKAILIRRIQSLKLSLYFRAMLLNFYSSRHT